MTSPLSKNIGCFRIIEEVGHGGMGIVYKAADPVTGKLVAVKISKPGNGASLRREASLLKRFDHLSLPKIIAEGSRNRKYFFVTPFLPGGSLQEKLRPWLIQKTPFREMLTVACQIACALDHIHGKGVIHFDVKPANILFDDAGLACLIDFGVARTLADIKEDDDDRGGTPLYMSPEAVLTSQKADGRTDIFSFGVVLYQMLTGVRPFRGDDTESIITMVLSADPIPLRRLNPAIPKGVDSLVLKALEKEPEDRFQTAAEMAAELQKELEKLRA